MKPGRNQPCPCGSGKKYKKCCYLKKGIESNFHFEEEEEEEEIEEEFPILYIKRPKASEMSDEEVIELIHDHLFFMGNEDAAIKHIIKSHGITEGQIEKATRNTKRG